MTLRNRITVRKLAIALVLLAVVAVPVAAVTYGTTADRPDDNTEVTGATQTSGVKINPNTNLDGVRCEVSSNTGSGIDTISLLASNGNTLVEKSPSNLGPGDQIDLTPSGGLTSGSAYYCVVNASGSSYTHGVYDSASYPYTSTDIDITSGYKGGSDNGAAAFSIDQVTAITSLTSTYSINTTVKDGNGNTVDSPSVTIIDQSNSSVTASGTGDGSGFLETAGLSDSETYDVYANADTYLNTSTSVTISGSDASTTINLDRPWINGTVTNPQGTRVEGATIYFTDQSNGSVAATATTDSNGRWNQPEIYNGRSYDVTVETDDHDNETKSISIDGSDGQLDFALSDDSGGGGGPIGGGSGAAETVQQAAEDGPFSFFGVDMNPAVQWLISLVGGLYAWTGGKKAKGRVVG